MTVILRLLKGIKPFHIVLIFFIGSVSYIGILHSRVSDQQVIIANHKAAQDSLKVVIEDTVSYGVNRLAFQTKDLESALTRKTNEFEDYKIFSDSKLENIRNGLLRQLNDKNQKIQSFTSIQLEHSSEHFQDSIKSISTIDSLTSELTYRDSIYIEEKLNNITLKGYVITQPMFSYYDFTTIIDPVGMEVYITKDKNGIFNTYLLLSDKQTRIPIANSVVAISNKPDILKRSLFSNFLNMFNLGVGYEYNESFENNLFYVRGSFSLSRFSQQIKFNEEGVLFFTEFNIWRR